MSRLKLYSLPVIAYKNRKHPDENCVVFTRFPRRYELVCSKLDLLHLLDYPSECSLLRISILPGWISSLPSWIYSIPSVEFPRFLYLFIRMSSRPEFPQFQSRYHRGRNNSTFALGYISSGKTYCDGNSKQTTTKKSYNTNCFESISVSEITSQPSLVPCNR